MNTEISSNDDMLDSSTEYYVSVGLSALRVIEAALRGRATPHCILDLPCGHGRITRLLRSRFPDAEITVSDIDPDGVAFTADRFRARGILSSSDLRNLKLGGPFDLIWVGSLITHLSEKMSRRLLDCLIRHMDLNATLIITSHGHRAAESMVNIDYGIGRQRTKRVLQEYEDSGYGYIDYPGIPNYGISVIAREWIEEMFRGSPLRLHRFIEQGWADHQDVLVLRPTAANDEGVQDNRLKRSLAVLPLLTGFRRRSSGSGWFESRYTPTSNKVVAPVENALPEFDEGWYLATYTDVASAVQKGELASAREHFECHGRAEGRLPRAPRRFRRNWPRT